MPRQQLEEGHGFFISRAASTEKFKVEPLADHLV